jgi:hypothetical protein
MIPDAQGHRAREPRHSAGIERPCAHGSEPHRHRGVGKRLSFLFLSQGLWFGTGGFATHPYRLMQTVTGGARGLWSIATTGSTACMERPASNGYGGATACFPARSR